MTNRKLDIVQRLLPQIPDDARPTEHHAMVTWWANIREEGGMRLTRHGYDMLHKVLKLESWSLDLTDDDSKAFRSRIDKRTVLHLDRKLTWPYYLDFNARKRTQRIVFFGSREAMMATMYGDINRWLESMVDQK